MSPENNGGQNNDSVFLELLRHVMQRIHPPRGLVYEVFYLRGLDRCGELAPRFEAIHREYLADHRKGRYRQVVTITHDTRRGEAYLGERYVHEVMAQLRFQVKATREYVDVERFEQECRELLRGVVEPYVAPGVVAEERLYRIGFRGDSVFVGEFDACYFGDAPRGGPSTPTTPLSS